MNKIINNTDLNVKTNDIDFQIYFESSNEQTDTIIIPIVSANYHIGKRFIQGNKGIQKATGKSKQLAPGAICQYKEAVINKDVYEIAQVIQNLPASSCLFNGSGLIDAESIDQTINIIRRKSTYSQASHDDDQKILKGIKQYNLDKPLEYFRQPFLESVNTSLFIGDIDKLLYSKINLDENASLTDVVRKIIDLVPALQGVSMYVQRSASSITKPEAFKGHFFIPTHEQATVKDHEKLAIKINMQLKQALQSDEDLLDLSIYNSSRLIYTNQNYICKNITIPHPYEGDIDCIIEGHLLSLGSADYNIDLPLETKKQNQSSKKPFISTKLNNPNNNTKSTNTQDKHANWKYWVKFKTKKEIVEKIQNIDSHLYRAIMAISMATAKKANWRDKKDLEIIEALTNCPRAKNAQDEWHKEAISNTYKSLKEGAIFKLDISKRIAKDLKKREASKLFDKTSIDYNEVPEISNMQITDRYYDAEVLRKLFTLKVKEKAILMTGSTNTGKSYSTAQILNSIPGISLLVISSRIVLVDKSAEQFNATSYADIPEIDRQKARKVSTTINSINLFPDNYDYIFIDELDEAMQQVIGTAKNNPLQITNTIGNLIQKIKNAKKVIIAQSFLSPETLQILKAAGVSGKQIAKLTNMSKPYSDKKLFQHHEKETMYQEMTDCIKAGIKFMVYCNTKKQTKEVHEFLKKHIKEDKLLLINSEEKWEQIQKEFTIQIDDQQLKEKVEKILEEKIAIIFSPTISSGNSYENTDYRKTFVFHHCVDGTAGPDTTYQGAHRNRCAEEVHFLIDENHLKLPMDIEQIHLENLINNPAISFAARFISLKELPDGRLVEMIKPQPITESEAIKLKYQVRDNTFKNYAEEFLLYWFSTVGYNIHKYGNELDVDHQEKIASKIELANTTIKKRNIDNFVLASPMDKQQLSELKDKPKTSMQQIEYEKGKIQEKTGIDLSKLNAEEQVNIRKFYNGKKMNAIYRLEDAQIDDKDIALLFVYGMIKNDVASIKTVFRNFIIKKLFEILGIKAVNGQLIVPEKCIYIPEMLINTTWGRIIKKHYSAFNALGFGKLNDEGLDPKKIGYLIKGLGLITRRITLSNSQLSDAEFADYCIKKEEANSASLSSTKNKRRNGYKISGFDELTQEILKNRFDKKVSNVVTFVEKLKKDRAKFPDLYSYAKNLKDSLQPTIRNSMLEPARIQDYAKQFGIGDDFIAQLFNSDLDHQANIDEINYRFIESDTELTPQQWGYLDDPENQANLHLYAGVIAQFAMQNERDHLNGA